MCANSYFTCKCNSKVFQIPRQSMCEWTEVFGPFLRSMPVSLGSWPIQHLTLRNFFLSKTFKKWVELFFPIQKGVFYVFFSEEVADQCNIIPLLLCRAKYALKKYPWYLSFLLSSRHHSCTSVAVPALPTCNLSVHSYLGKPPRSHAKKSLGDFKMSAKWIQTAREISITSQIRLCFVPFFSFLVDIFLLYTK